MATFNDAVVTNAGLTLLSDAQAGYITGINFVGARTGNGTYDGTETLAQMTGLKSQKQSFNIDSVSRIGDNTLRLQFTITNKLGASELQVGYDIKELGIYANDGENVILFAIVTADQWDHLNAYDGVMAQTMTISFFLEVSNDTQITITAPNDNDLVTFGALAEALASVNTELPTASASTLGGVKVGDNLSIDENGVLSATDTTYGNATTSQSGLMSASDKTKLDGSAPKASPTFTGSPKAPTKSATDNSTNIATTAHVKAVLDDKIVMSTTDLEDGVSELATGKLYLVYETTE